MNLVKAISDIRVIRWVSSKEGESLNSSITERYKLWHLGVSSEYHASPSGISAFLFLFVTCSIELIEDLKVRRIKGSIFETFLMGGAVPTVLFEIELFPHHHGSVPHLGI